MNEQAAAYATNARGLGRDFILEVQRVARSAAEKPLQGSPSDDTRADGL